VRDTEPEITMRKSLLLTGVSPRAFFPWNDQPDLDDYGMGDVWTLR